ncbi:MAG TPA: hypothetical protein VJ875_09170 [Pyrinomonadaceae bacterium]|nr:hypothetical protein [Pyrinomonadaceae bacterium]
MSKLTYFFLLLVAGTIILSADRHPKPIPTATASQKNRDDYKRINERFPTANYNDEQDLPDPENNAKRKAKQKRYNDGDLVPSHVEPGVDEAALTLEPHFTFPPLPVAESEIVVVGTIGTAQALLSESKRNVFSEFTLAVEDVLKSKIQGVAQGSVLTIDRVGGHVKYPNGQRVLFRITGLNMPQVGGRYLLFLTSKHNNQDISILTAYQLTPNGSIPLDELDQVARLTGVTEVDILQRVRNLIRDSAK